MLQQSESSASDSNESTPCPSPPGLHSTSTGLAFCAASARKTLLKMCAIKPTFLVALLIQWLNERHPRQVLSHTDKMCLFRALADRKKEGKAESIAISPLQNRESRLPGSQ